MRAGTVRAAWLAQPAYLLAEVLVAATTGVGYSLRDDTISALGATCTSSSPTGCSSTPVLMNSVFVVFGVLQAVGAWALLRRPAVRAATRVGALWVVAGLFSVGVGLAPVDRHPSLHAMVALPVFVCQPLALLLHARLLAHGRVRVAGTLLGLLALVGAVAFGFLLGADHWAAAAERLAIWPAKLWLPLAALASARPRPAAAPPARPRRDGTPRATRPRG